MSTLFVFTSVSFADPNIASNTNSATCDDSTLETYSGTSNLSANWGANTINLHWYADSESTTELTVPTTSQTCVYDSTLTPPPVSSIPQKTGYTFAGWKVRGLPDGYTKLQYIEATGTQYIDTDYIPVSTEFKVQTKIVPLTYANSVNMILGTVNQSTLDVFLVNNQIIYAGANNDCIYNSGASLVNKTVVINGVFSSTTPRRHLYGTINGNSYNVTTDTNPINTSAANSKISIFRHNGDNYRGAMKMYYLKVYDNGTLVLNLIPAKNSNNVVGMYDTVTKTFFTNSGTGSFGAGPVAQ